MSYFTKSRGRMTVLTAYIPLEYLNQVRELARSQNISISQLIRQVLDEKLKSQAAP